MSRVWLTEQFRNFEDPKLTQILIFVPLTLLSFIIFSIVWISLVLFLSSRCIPPLFFFFLFLVCSSPFPSFIRLGCLPCLTFRFGRKGDEWKAIGEKRIEANNNRGVKIRSRIRKKTKCTREESNIFLIGNADEKVLKYYYLEEELLKEESREKRRELKKHNFSAMFSLSVFALPSLRDIILYFQQMRVVKQHLNYRVRVV